MKNDYGSKRVWLVYLLVLIVSGCATMAATTNEPIDLDIIDRWSGDFPVAELDRLPNGQRQYPTGYIGDQPNFVAVWQVLVPGETVPEVDFGRHLVVFSRNVNFYNRTNILKVTLSGGGAEILAMETMSAMPIEEKVAMAIAVVPRAGINFIRSGDLRVRVTDSR